MPPLWSRRWLSSHHSVRVKVFTRRVWNVRLPNDQITRTRSLAPDGSRSEDRMHRPTTFWQDATSKDHGLHEPRYGMDGRCPRVSTGSASRPRWLAEIMRSAHW